MNELSLGSAPKILLVEDEAIIARDIQRQLTNSGFAVTGTARTAADAFEQIEESLPDLVLMDISIKGGIDGIEAAHIVRERYAVPVIYLTAHADENTLQRAQLTEPFGYIVKPLGNTNVKAVATMALHKHRMERELENHRKMLSAILQGLPDAVIVAGVSGEVLFLNPAAEQLTGWTHRTAVGKSLVEIAPIEDGRGCAVSAELLHQAVTLKGVVPIPRNSVVVSKSRGAIEISGQLAVTSVGNMTAGIFVTLRDTTIQKREEQKHSQEQQLLVAGDLAGSVAQEFYGLFDLMGDCASQLAEDGQKTDLDIIRQASQVGKDMSLQLIDFRDCHGVASVVNVAEYLVESKLLLARWCGAGLEFEVNCEADCGYILSTGNHLEQMLMHLVLDASNRVKGWGKVTLTAGVQAETVRGSLSQSYVRLSVCSEPWVQQKASGNPDLFPGDAERPNLHLPIVRAIATASGGFTRELITTKSESLFEVFLPRHESRNSARIAAKEPRRAVLAVGLPNGFVDGVQRAAGEHALVLEAASLGEASLIAELYPGDIQLVVVNDSDVLQIGTGRAADRIRARRPDTVFVSISSHEKGGEMAALTPGDLEQRVESFFDRRAARAIASGGA